MTAGAGGAKGMHRWRFCRLGGVDQVLLANGNDIAALDQLDQKLDGLRRPGKAEQTSPMPAPVVRQP